MNYVNYGDRKPTHREISFAAWRAQLEAELRRRGVNPELFEVEDFEWFYDDTHTIEHAANTLIDTSGPPA